MVHEEEILSIIFYFSKIVLGLFKNAIIMSGVLLKMNENPNEKAKIVANELGCPTNDSLSMVNCLRNRPANHIVALAPKLQVFVF